MINWLREYPSLSGAQIYDWLLENFSNIKVGESTVRRYVNKMRELYQIEKIDEPREYEAVDDQPLLILFPYEGAEQYIQDVCYTYGRYRRDQLLLFKKIATESPEWISRAVEKCIQEKLYSANEFRTLSLILSVRKQNPELKQL
ncbi:hypothetical protein [Lysinibacillus sp. NPDC093692]|uniref:hypothetical protein n=1 Tax=Lysinibacillus sp. NPDC093692 TaxID=3390578 RepID=UPI003D092666